MVKARPRNYARYMLGLHKDVWKGVKVEEYVRKEREAWGETPPQEPSKAQTGRNR